METSLLLPDELKGSWDEMSMDSGVEFKQWSVSSI